jgi:hypothetical protein
MSPTARTLDRLRQLGYLACVVERWLPRVQQRADLFGCIDVVGIKPGVPILGVQATTIGHVAHRLAKARALPALAVWLRAGADFQVWGWAKRGQRWEVKQVMVQAEDLQPVLITAPRRRRRPGKGERQRGLFDGDAAG